MKQHTLTATVIGVEFKWETEFDTNNSLVVKAARKGFQEWLQDAASTAKPETPDESDINGKATKACRTKAMRKRYGRIVDGTYKPGQGGGGSRQSPEEKAWILFFNTIKHQEGGKPVNGNTLLRAQEWHVRQYLLQSADPGTEERKDIEKNLGKYVEARFDVIIKQEEMNNRAVAMGIEYQRMLASVPAV